MFTLRFVTRTVLLKKMRVGFGVSVLFLAWAGFAPAADEPRLLTKVSPLPVALDPAFQFRKTKLFLLTEQVPNLKGGYQAPPSDDQSDASNTGGLGKAGKLSNTSPSTKTATAQDASIMFERQYRLFGAVTKLDRRQRYGNYFDFFWRANRAAPITVRLEYRQEKLHSHVQAQETSYPSAHGNIKTEFKVIGDDYLDDGRVIAWRCLLIEQGKIVAEDRSYMWD
jgi:hypothetical protein